MKADDYAAFSRVFRLYFHAWPNVCVDDTLVEYWWGKLRWYDLKAIDRALDYLSDRDHAAPSLARVKGYITSAKLLLGDEAPPPAEEKSRAAADPRGD